MRSLALRALATYPQDAGIAKQLRRCVCPLLIMVSSFVWAAGQSSTNYAIFSDTINAGVGVMASANYHLQSSLGDGFAGGGLASTGFTLGSGFWNQVTGQSGLLCLLDLDGNGTADALTDGLMILRVLFGLTGTSVTSDAVGTGASRTTGAQIQPVIHPSALDVDGNGATDALTDGLIIIRSLSGLTGTAVTNGAVGAGGRVGRSAGFAQRRCARIEPAQAVAGKANRGYRNRLPPDPERNCMSRTTDWFSTLP